MPEQARAEDPCVRRATRSAPRLLPNSVIGARSRYAGRPGGREGDGVREIVAFLYPDAFRAAEVMAGLHRLRPEATLELDDAVSVTCDSRGRLRLHFAQRPAPGVSGAQFWHLLIGPLVAPDLEGAARRRPSGPHLGRRPSAARCGRS